VYLGGHISLLAVDQRLHLFARWAFPQAACVLMAWYPEQATREREREPKMELAIFSNLILEVACYYFCCILFVTWTILGAV